MTVDRSPTSSRHPLSPKISAAGTSRKILDSQTIREGKTGKTDTITWPVQESVPHEVTEECENKPPGSLKSSHATNHAVAEEGTKISFFLLLLFSPPLLPNNRNPWIQLFCNNI
jgi:hypothetical protein